MIVKPGKFQAMIINRFGEMENNNETYIDNKKITSEHSVKLLGLEIDNNQLKFDNHVSTLCRKAGSQLNAIGRLRKYIGFPEKMALIEAFVFSNFDYCPLVWHFTSMTSSSKIGSIQKRALQVYVMDILAPVIVFLQKQINHRWN